MDCFLTLWNCSHVPFPILGLSGQSLHLYSHRITDLVAPVDGCGVRKAEVVFSAAGSTAILPFSSPFERITSLLC